MTKCNFCRYYLSGECVATKTNGKVNEYYCRQAQYEYNQWLRQQKQKQKSWR
jgi:hypothetical protein